MTYRDPLLLELHNTEVLMRDINPNTSTYQKLDKRKKELEQKLSATHHELHT